MRTTHRTLLAVAIAMAILAVPSFALGYFETPGPPWPSINPANCGGCHNPYFSLATCVHGNYTTSGNKCEQCHTVHAGTPGADKLLPAVTITATCFTCHDGTAGYGVYGAINARIPAATTYGHRTETTFMVPGGSDTTGGPVPMAFGGQGGTLTCSDCHSPHASNVVDPYVGDRLRYDGWPQPFTTSKLLRRNPGGSAVSVTKYGSDWCLGCHAGRNSGGAVHNHPVDSASTHATPFNYSAVALVQTAGVATGVTVIGQMGGVQAPADASTPGGNRGFLMPDPRTAQQAGHAPICQQCHEDSRSVGSLVSGGSQALVTAAVITNSDGNTASDNPRFQNFPHETLNYRMLIENDDDLCLNCHAPTALP